MTAIIVLFNLKSGASVEQYEQWAQRTDLPTVRGLAAVDEFEVLRTTGLLSGAAAAPFQYVEILRVSSVAALKSGHRRVTVHGGRRPPVPRVRGIAGVHGHRSDLAAGHAAVRKPPSIERDCMRAQAGWRFYGWWGIVLPAFVVIWITNALTLAGINVFDGHLLEELAMSRGALKFGDTIQLLSSAALAPLGGWVADRYGVRPAMTAGALVLALALYLFSTVDSLGDVYLLRFAMGASLAGAGLVVCVTLVSRWFVSRRGLALGLMLSGDQPRQRAHSPGQHLDHRPARLARRLHHHLLHPAGAVAGDLAGGQGVAEGDRHRTARRRRSRARPGADRAATSSARRSAR